MHNKKVMLLISSELFHRNYVQTGVVAFLARNYKNLVLLASETISEIDFEKVIKYKLNEQHENRHYQFLRIISWRYRHLSRSFKFRLIRNSKFKFEFQLNTKKNSLIAVWSENFNSFKRRIKILTAGSKIFFPIVKYFFDKRLQPAKELLDIISKEQPDLILMPSSAYDPVVVDLIKISKMLSIKSILLVDNWDNISSKSILLDLPDGVTVWGEQTKEHAKNIQNFRDEQISCIGTPRFENYFRLRNKKLYSHFDFKYVLYLGQSLPSDEISVVKTLNSLLTSDEFYGQGLKLIYRPHPWAVEQGIPDLSDLEAVILDPQILARDPLREDVVSFQPSLEYYPSLLKNAEFVVSSLTSMIIEASIFHKNVIVICHHEPGNYTSPDKLRANCMHFEGIERLSNVIISNSHQELQRYAKKLILNEYNLKAGIIDSELSYFIAFEGSYNERLKKCIDHYLLGKQG